MAGRYFFLLVFSFLLLPALPQIADTTVCQANMLYQSGRYAEAVEVYRSAEARLTATDFIKLGQALYLENNFIEAKIAFTRANQLSRNSAAFYLACTFARLGETDSMYFFSQPIWGHGINFRRQPCILTRHSKLSKNRSSG